VEGAGAVKCLAEAAEGVGEEGGEE